jgi:hypothetical protein
MAYQTRQRDPFLDQETHAILVRRGQEVLGLVLLGLGIALAALMLSYTPDDPNWMAATDTAPKNLLGRTGASVAAILMMIVGYGALVLPIACIVWGVRFLLHAGRDRALCRVCSSCRSSWRWHRSTRPATCRRLEWTHSFGLGRSVRGYRSRCGAERLADFRAAWAQGRRGGGVSGRCGDAVPCGGHQFGRVSRRDAVSGLRAYGLDRDGDLGLRGVGAGAGRPQAGA